MVQKVIWFKKQYWIWNPHQISKLKKENIKIGPETTKLCYNLKQPGYWTFVVSESIEGKYNIGF